MKKFFLVLMVTFLMFSSSCFAMTFSQPIETGFSVRWFQSGGGFAVINASANDGDFYKREAKGKTIIYDGSNKSGSIRYGKGVARWGDESDALYVHYDSYNFNYNVLFGDKNIRNTIPVSAMIFGERIFKINTDSGITFYMINTSYDLPDEIWWTLIGRREDGVWVKYFDSDSVTEQYFGKSARAGHGNVWSGSSICCYDFKVNGGTMTIEYSRFHKNLGERGEFVKSGEFRFKWDDKAHWFSVEQVTY